MTEMQIHHHPAPLGTVRDTNAIVAITATPGNTSRAKAPTREGHGAKAFRDDCWIPVV